MARSLSSLRSSLRGASFNQIGSMYASGKISESELRRFYSEERKIANKREARLQAAGLAGQTAEFRKTTNLATVQDLVREIADVNRYLQGKTTVRERRAEVRQKLDKMHGRGMFENVNERNFSKFARFMDWARSTSLLQSFSSESDVIEETVDTVINTGASTASEFAEIFSAVIGEL